MTDGLDLPRRYREQLESLLREHVPGVEVWAYGSRVNGKGHEASDLDIVLRGPALEPLRDGFFDLLEAIENSNIPILVQAHDWAKLPDSFHREIERDYVVLQEVGPKQLPAGGWHKYDVSALIAEKALVIGDGYRAKNTELSRVGLPFARAGNIRNGFQLSGAACFPQDQLHKVGEKMSRPGDAVFTSKGTVGRFAFVRDDTPCFVYSPQLSYWRVINVNVIEPRFLHYWMTSREFFAQFKSVAGQTDMAEYVSLSDQRRMYIRLPPINEQRAIAHVLGTLDDKIELNRRMNETLEEMARALFKSWFVDFKPVRAKMEGRWRRGQSLPGLPAEHYDLFPDRLVDSELGESPEGWEVKPLGELVHTTKGRSYRSGELKESATALVTLKSFARGGGYRPDGLKPYVGPFKAEQTISPGEIVISCTDVTQAAEVIGRPAIVEASPLYKTLVASLDTLIVRPDPEIMSPEFLYLLTSTPQFTSHTYAHATGTTVLHLAKGAVPSFRFAAPKSQILTAFDALVAPVFTRARRIQQDLHLLTSQRDTLLPGLVTGQVGVRNEDD